MDSTISSPTSSAIADNEREISLRELSLRERFGGWLAGVVRQPGVHARFVNTLSLLEHIGSVKIARTQSGESITEEILQHLAEETRHAQVLKRIARAIDFEVAADYTDPRLLVGAAARGYFARLDVGVRGFVRRGLPLEAPAPGPSPRGPVESAAGWCAGRGAGGPVTERCAGMKTRKVVPLPTVLSTSTQPWCCLTMP